MDCLDEKDNQCMVIQAMLPVTSPTDTWARGHIGGSVWLEIDFCADYSYQLHINWTKLNIKVHIQDTNQISYFTDKGRAANLWVKPWSSGVICQMRC